MGAALGNIIPTIMMAHITNMNNPSTISHGRGVMTVLVMSESPAPIEDIEPANTRRYTQANAVTPAKESTMAIRSREERLLGDNQAMKRNYTE
jgi:hypothetical protein